MRARCTAPPAAAARRTRRVAPDCEVDEPAAAGVAVGEIAQVIRDAAVHGPRDARPLRVRPRRLVRARRHRRPGGGGGGRGGAAAAAVGSSGWRTRAARRAPGAAGAGRGRAAAPPRGPGPRPAALPGRFRPAGGDAAAGGRPSGPLAGRSAPEAPISSSARPTTHMSALYGVEAVLSRALGRVRAVLRPPAASVPLARLLAPRPDTSLLGLVSSAATQSKGAAPDPGLAFDPTSPPRPPHSLRVARAPPDCCQTGALLAPIPMAEAGRSTGPAAAGAHSASGGPAAAALSLFGLAGKKCLVTGGTKGIGRAVAEALASLGAEVGPLGARGRMGAAAAGRAARAAPRAAGRAARAAPRAAARARAGPLTAAGPADAPSPGLHLLSQARRAARGGGGAAGRRPRGAWLRRRRLGARRLRGARGRRLSGVRRPARRPE
jgi:hypothetical protein